MESTSEGSISCLNTMENPSEEEGSSLHVKVCLEEVAAVKQMPKKPPG